MGEEQSDWQIAPTRLKGDFMKTDFSHLPRAPKGFLVKKEEGHLHLLYKGEGVAKFPLDVDLAVVKEAARRHVVFLRHSVVCAWLTK